MPKVTLENSGQAVNRYVLLAGFIDGLLGWDNYQASGDSIEVLKSMMISAGRGWFDVAVIREDALDLCCWWQIVDLSLMEIIESGNGDDLIKI